MLSVSLSYLGLALMTGHATWRGAVNRNQSPGREEGWFFGGGFLLALAAAIIRARQATLSAAGDLSGESLALVMLETPYGLMLAVHMALLFTTGMGYLQLRIETGTGQRPLLLIPAAATVATQGMLGHVSAAFAIHALAVVAWLGALLALTACMQSVQPRRFALLAAGSVALFVTTGALIARDHMGGWPIFDNPYGLILLVKVLLVAGSLAIATNVRSRFAVFTALMLAILALLATAALSRIPPR
ncbi:MAG: hypothetical protein WD696_13595 [Bryobacteraceae bacterium]